MPSASHVNVSDSVKIVRQLVIIPGTRTTMSRRTPAQPNTATAGVTSSRRIPQIQSLQPVPPRLIQILIPRWSLVNDPPHPTPNIRPFRPPAWLTQVREANDWSKREKSWRNWRGCVAFEELNQDVYFIRSPDPSTRREPYHSL